jgi:hypothetical protein
LPVWKLKLNQDGSESKPLASALRARRRLFEKEPRKERGVRDQPCRDFICLQSFCSVESQSLVLKNTALPDKTSRLLNEARLALKKMGKLTHSLFAGLGGLPSENLPKVLQYSKQNHFQII